MSDKPESVREFDHVDKLQEIARRLAKLPVVEKELELTRAALRAAEEALEVERVICKANEERVRLLNAALTNRNAQLAAVTARAEKAEEALRQIAEEGERDADKRLWLTVRVIAAAALEGGEAFPLDDPCTPSAIVAGCSRHAALASAPAEKIPCRCGTGVLCFAHLDAPAGHGKGEGK